LAGDMRDIGDGEGMGEERRQDQLNRG
jgi:hypothetical protein